MLFQNSILIVDDDTAQLKQIELELKSFGITNLVTCSNSQEVMGILSTQKVEVVILDLFMPGLTGEELLVSISSAYPHLPVIIMTGFNDVEVTIRCMKRNVFDFLLKPVDISLLIRVIRKAKEWQDLQLENNSLKQCLFEDKLKNPKAFNPYVTNSINSSMYSVFKYMESIAKSSAPVLISGETGVGKDLIARIIHDLSMQQGAFIAVNIAGLDSAVFSDTLFGHKKGAFTSADGARKGLVEQAAKGTLLLDEIGDLSQASQVKLLRLLEEGEYFQIGCDNVRRCETRFIFSSHCDLLNMINEGNFRKDLFYRLQTHHIEIPPLRKRLEDLPVLVDHFLELASTHLRKKKPTPPRELITLLSTYHFPGNIRELKSMIYDAVSRHDKGKLSMDSFKIAMEKGERRVVPREDTTKNSIEFSNDRVDFSLTINGRMPMLKDVEDVLIGEAIKRTAGNQSIAAKMLGISRPTLNKRLSALNKINITKKISQQTTQNP
jgi:DNA-binding NtrC family response regulator